MKLIVLIVILHSPFSIEPPTIIPYYLSEGHTLAECEKEGERFMKYAKNKFKDEARGYFCKEVELIPPGEKI